MLGKVSAMRGLLYVETETSKFKARKKTIQL